MQGAFKIVLVMDILKKSFSNFWVPVSYRWYIEKESRAKYELVSNVLSALISVLFFCIVIGRFVLIRILDPAYFESAN
jgi:O-antigen/teichoic acid export membrane protein